MRCCKKIYASRGSVTALSLLPFLADVDLQTRKNKSKVLVLSPFFRCASPSFFSDMFHCRSFFGLRLHLLRFGWPVYDQRAAGDWASYTSVQMDGDMFGSVG
jgi:hypothetical protein